MFLFKSVLKYVLSVVHVLSLTCLMSYALTLIKLLKRLIKQDHLYTDEKLREMKQTLKLAEEEFAELEAKESKGFGK